MIWIRIAYDLTQPDNMYVRKTRANGNICKEKQWNGLRLVN